MAPHRSREIRFAAHPEGLPGPECFELEETEVPDPGEGQFLVRNLWMSVDPYMRGRMMARRSYVPGFELGKPLEGGAIGRVVASRHPDFPEGSLVSSMAGWRELFVSDGTLVGRIEPEPGVPVQAYLGVMGMPGLTAYVGLLDVARLGEGEQVFVSAAAGAVGATACQIAKIRNCRVVGSAGTPEKCRWLEEACGVDATICYREVPDLTRAVAEAFPEGIDVYFENVGGAHLEAALESMKDFGRIPLCGMISRYNDDRPVPGPANLVLAVGRRLRLEGFIVSDHFGRLGDFQRDMAGWIREGRMKWRETVVEGLENAPQAFLGLFEGRNLGKMLVRLADG